MMLRPRDDEDQKVLDADIEITPAPADLTWTLSYVSASFFFRGSSSRIIPPRNRIEPSMIAGIAIR